MTSASPNPAASLRGTAAGLMTAALAVAAHAVGSGAAPTGAATAQLAVLAATVGALAATIARADDPRVLLCLLGTGQLVGHVLLGTVGHSHQPATAPPAAAMLAAHLAAVAAGGAFAACATVRCGVASVRQRPGPSARHWLSRRSSRWPRPISRCARRLTGGRTTRSLAR